MKKKKKMSLSIVLILLTLLPMVVASAVITVRSVSTLNTMVMDEIEDELRGVALTSAKHFNRQAQSGD